MRHYCKPMSNGPLCQVGDIVQYDWDKDDNIFLITDVKSDYYGWLYQCLSLINGRYETFQFGMAPLEILA